MLIPNCLATTTKTIIIKSIYLEMILKFNTKENFEEWLNGQTLPSGIVVYVSDDETMYFSTNNIKGELKTYKC